MGRKKTDRNAFELKAERNETTEELTARYEKRLYDLQQLLEVARSLCSTLDYPTLIESILYTCMCQMRVLGAGIFVLDDFETEAYSLSNNYTGMDLDSQIDYTIPMASPLVALLNEKEKVFTVRDLQRKLPDEKLDQIYSLKPSLIVPLFQKNRMNGILLLGERMDLGDGTSYSDYDIKQILSISSLASMAINNAALLERSSTDMMTRLKLKYFFFNQLTDRLDLAYAQGLPIGVIMFDIDHFKSFNDTHGHTCGDYVLTTVAKVIKNSIRSQDMASRYGGEEFTVMLPNTLKEDAMQVAERIRSNIENMEFNYEGQIVKVTISGGVSVFDKEENPVTSAKEFVIQADKALYVSKTSGRNRITFADKSIIDSDVKTEN
ncbi:MAG: sensor domain-containing diguanylate cyclase [Treponema sp.]|nr:sensor domain-containing diguanylate cyclase [Treponema sp.]MBQ9626566.1 sensor domain-containing diguanylate cyclase [Treponema sp.]